MSYRGFFKPKHPEKYVGNSKNIIWRSTWENKMMKWLDTTSDVLKWASEEIFVHYFDPVTNKVRRYFPDFYVKLKQSDGSIKEFIVEVKPMEQTILPSQKRKTKRFNQKVAVYITNTKKWEAAKKFCEEKGWDFKLITEHELFNHK